ncbi:MAG: hypothetical protein M3Z21_04820 [Pseudomonadota bacterium]|nr:hypothetical protein [Pseudomonadota bacterium]
MSNQAGGAKAKVRRSPATGKFALKGRAGRKTRVRCFVEGAASIAEIYPVTTVTDYDKLLKNILAVIRRASDADALRSDWECVGQDLRRAFHGLQDESGQKR